jgi:hypothetical protein
MIDQMESYAMSLTELENDGSALGVEEKSGPLLP